MSVYVFALVDRPPAGKAGTGLAGPLSLRRVGDAFAVIERRADVPPAEFGSLQRHQAVVASVAARVPAIIPVRFGTLMDLDALEEALHERDQDLEEAFATVRGRVQFTWRRPRSRVATVSKGSSGTTGPPLSGAEYLRRLAKRSRPTPPPAWRPLRARLAALVDGELYQPANGKLPDSLYHLVARDTVRSYQNTAERLRRDNPAFIVTGPFPPFAFAPELL